MKKGLLLFLVLGLISALFALPALAQDPAQTPACVPDAVTGCAQINLPAGLTGDLIQNNPDGTTIPVAVQQNSFSVPYVFPEGQTSATLNYTVTNIRDADPNFGILYTYNPITKDVVFKPNQTTTVALTSPRVFIAGTLALTCDIRNWVAEAVGCRISIDGVPQEPALLPGEIRNYVLPPGAHAVIATLEGANANLWAPASRTQNVTIQAGRTATFKPQFSKAGRLLISLNPALPGDIYVDGVLLAAQVTTAEAWVEPAKPHTVEVKNVTDPAAAGIYRWKDFKVQVTVNSGQDKPVVANLVQEYLVGFLTINCNITNIADAPGATCMPTVNGVGQPAMQSGTSVTLNLPPGPLSVNVVIGPPGVWTASAVNNNSTLQVGKTVTVNASLTATIPTFPLAITNNSGRPVCTLYAAPLTDTNPPVNRLTNGQRINVGASKTFNLPANTYAILAEDCNGLVLGLAPVVPLGPVNGFNWTIPPRPTTGGSPVNVVFSNESSYPICYIYVTPTTEIGWGLNWLGFNNVLDPGETVTLPLATGSWDYSIEPCDRSGVWERFFVNLVGPLVVHLYN